jgi:transcriptional regulator with XRE-family HTH domain
VSEIKARRLTDIIKDHPEDHERMLLVQTAARVANAIERIREREHVTLAELADRVGSSTSQMSRVLSGEYTGMTLTTLVKIADGLGYQPEISFRRVAVAGNARAALRSAHAAPALARASVRGTLRAARTGRRIAG